MCMILCALGMCICDVHACYTGCIYTTILCRWFILCVMYAYYVYICRTCDMYVYARLFCYTRVRGLR